jgi:hypothetical protein
MRNPNVSRTPANFKQSDVVRAINAARASGLVVVRTEIDPDGRIVLVHVDGSSRSATVNELDAWRAKRHARSA